MYPKHISLSCCTALVGLAALLWTTGCGDDDNPAGAAEPEWLPVATAAADGVGVTLSGLESPVVGYNRLRLELRDTETDAPWSGAVTVTPMMHMTRDDGSTMSHSGPVPLTGGPVDADGRVAAEVVFLMAGAWELRVVPDGGDQITLPFEVAPSSRVQALSDGDTRLFVSLVEPLQPRVGMNDLVLAVHRRETMMSFPGIEGLDVAFEPSMPSMGHGSPNNVDPEGLGDGLCRGAVNFTMTGDWQLDVALSADGRALPSAQFQLTVR